MILGLLVLGFLFGGEVFCEEPVCINYTPNRFEYEHSVLGKLIYLENFKTDATARIAALERQLQGASTTSPLTQRSSSTYIHWGMQSCPNVTATTMVYSGQAAGGHFQHTGSGEYICLPNDPEYDKYNQINETYRSLMYGAEYESPATDLVFGNLVQYDVPCSVCLARGKTTLMIPGRTSCYGGWTKEYQGYLMGEYHGFQGKGYVCMDKNAEALPGSFVDHNGALFYIVEGRCGALKCPPYIEGAELACVVCSNNT